jgi:type IV pilus assembly protein PilB
MSKKRLGEVLCERGHLGAADLKRTLQEQQGKAVRLGELLLQRKLVSKKDLAAALQEVSGIEYVDCQSLDPAPEALDLVPQALAKKCCAVPLESNGKMLLVVMAEPQNLHLMDELRFKTGLKINPKFGFRNEVIAALDRLYGTSGAHPTAIHVSDDTTGMEFISSSS